MFDSDLGLVLLRGKMGTPSPAHLSCLMAPSVAVVMVVELSPFQVVVLNLLGTMVGAKFSCEFQLRFWLSLEY